MQPVAFGRHLPEARRKPDSSVRVAVWRRPAPPSRPLHIEAVKKREGENAFVEAARVDVAL